MHQTASDDPSPTELAEAADEPAQLKQGLDEAQRSMLDMRLDGLKIEEFSQKPLANPRGRSASENFKFELAPRYGTDTEKSEDDYD